MWAEVLRLSRVVCSVHCLFWSCWSGLQHPPSHLHLPNVQCGCLMLHHTPFICHKLKIAALSVACTFCIHYSPTHVDNEQRQSDSLVFVLRCTFAS